MTEKTLYDKLWDAHVVREDENGASLLYFNGNCEQVRNISLGTFTK